MKQPPRTGLTGEHEITVGPDNRISFADGRMPAVLATPWLVAYLEHSCPRRDRRHAWNSMSAASGPSSRSSIWPLLRKGSRSPVAPA